VPRVYCFNGIRSRRNAINHPTFGSIERKDAADKRSRKTPGSKSWPAVDWAEGPVWQKGDSRLGIAGRVPSCSFDIPPNRSWSPPSNEAIIFMHPAGYTAPSRGGEPGTNGLTLDKEGHLVARDHAIAAYRLEANGTKKTPPTSMTAAAQQPQRLCYKSNGDLYFTDPPYGLKRIDDPGARSWTSAACIA
jgi:gluconolactonase